MLNCQCLLAFLFVCIGVVTEVKFFKMEALNVITLWHALLLGMCNICTTTNNMWTILDPLDKSSMTRRACLENDGDDAYFGGGFKTATRIPKLCRFIEHESYVFRGPVNCKFGQAIRTVEIQHFDDVIRAYKGDPNQVAFQ